MGSGRRIHLWITVLVLGGLLAGCASQRAPIEPERPDVIGRAAQSVAERYGENPDELEILRAEEVTWPSAALGCPRPGQLYAQGTVEGFRIIFGSADRVRTWELHTNADATAIVHCEDGRPAP